MSIFSTAIKTLSDIAIQESSVELPTETKSTLVEEVQEMLDDLPSLNAVSYTHLTLPTKHPV